MWRFLSVSPSLFSPFSVSTADRCGAPCSFGETLPLPPQVPLVVEGGGVKRVPCWVCKGSGLELGFGKGHGNRVIQCLVGVDGRPGEKQGERQGRPAGGAFFREAFNDDSTSAPPSRTASSTTGSLQSSRESALLSWKGHLGDSFDSLNRGSLLDPAESRNVVALVGITGSGKSSTGNTMSYRPGKKEGFREVLARSARLGARRAKVPSGDKAVGEKKRVDGDGDGGRPSSLLDFDLDSAGVPLPTKLSSTADHGQLELTTLSTRPERNRRFAVATNSLTSVTKSTTYRDYSYRGVPYRVIDTPGLFDTNRSPSEVRQELRDFRIYARYGVAAFVLVLPTGRITQEHARALEAMEDVLGPDFARHAIIVFTSALTEKPGQRLLTRDVILEEVNKLPRGHFLRVLVGRAGGRVLGVDNRQEPHRFTSQVLLNQGVLDVLEANGGRRFEIGEEGEKNEEREGQDELKDEKDIGVDARKKMGGGRIRGLFSFGSSDSARSRKENDRQGLDRGNHDHSRDKCVDSLKKLIEICGSGKS